MVSKSEYSFYQFRRISVSEDGTIMKFVCIYQTNKNEEIEAFRNQHNAIVIWFNSANNHFSVNSPELEEEDNPSFTWVPKYKLVHGELVGDFGTNGSQFLWMDGECGSGLYELLLVTGQATCLFLERYLAGEHDQSLSILRQFADGLATQVL